VQAKVISTFVLLLMNRELLTRYHSLSADERKFIRNKASESPVLLKLLNFLDSCKEQNFTTLAAVRAIYPEEVAHVPFPKLRNRFFKIRKELLSFRSEIQPEQAGTLIGHPLEIQFIQLRELVRTREADTALRGLRELTKECKKLNLFEIYSRVLQERIYGLLLSNNHVQAKVLLQELEESIEAHYAWNKMYLYYRQAFENNLQHAGFKEVKTLLKKMKTLSREFEVWPRFKLAYLFAALTFETAHSRSRAQVVGKYFKQIEELLSQYPEMPVFYFGIDHRITTLFQIEQFRATYYFIQGNFETAYQSSLRNWTRSEQGVIKRPIAENEYRNRIKLELITGRYQEALQTAQRLIQYQKSAGLLENIPSSYKEMALIYIYSFPHILPDNPELLLKHLEEKLKLDALQTGKDSRDYSETLTTRAALLLIIRKYAEAYEDIQNPFVQQYYGAVIYPVILDLYQLPIKARKLNKLQQKEILEQTLLEMDRKKNATQDPLYQHMIQFVMKTLHYFLEKGF
jgi:hypothetical protein